MRKSIQITFIAAAAIMPLLIAGTVAADATNNCSIYNTGSDSYNACVANNDNKSYVQCVNNVYTVYTNSQSATSGDANSDGNTTSGNTTSGSAVNANGTTVTIGASCGTTPTTTTPGTGGGGTTATTTTTTPTPQATTNTNTQPAAKPTATVLPETGSNFLTESAIIGLVATAVLLACSKIGVSFLQRVSQK